MVIFNVKFGNARTPKVTKYSVYTHSIYKPENVIPACIMEVANDSSGFLPCNACAIKPLCSRGMDVGFLVPETWSQK